MKNIFKKSLSLLLVFLMTLSVLVPLLSPFVIKASAADDIDWLWPVPENYSMQRGYYMGVHDHNGIDIRAPHGTPIVAAYDGTVELYINKCKHDNKTICTSCDSTGTGNGLIVKHVINGKIYCTFYAHMVHNSIPDKFREKGAAVKKGEIIGKVGSTGASTIDHLHFSIASYTTDSEIKKFNQGKYWSGTYLNNNPIDNGSKHKYNLWSGKDKNGKDYIKTVKYNYSLFLTVNSFYQTMQTVQKTTERNKPYETGKVVKELPMNTKVNVVATYINIYGNIWYKTSSGNWIYGKRLTDLPLNTVTYKPAKSTNQTKTKEKIELPATAIIIEDEGYTIPAEIPVRDGYRFMGWALTEDAKEAQFQAGEVISAADLDEIVGEGNGFSLYPVWKQTETTMKLDKYDVKLEANSCSTVTIRCTGELKNAHRNMTCTSDNEDVAVAKVIYSFYENWILWDQLTNKIEIEAKNPGTANIKIEVYNTSGKLLISKSVFVKVDASYNISYYDDTDGKITNKQTKKYNKDITLLDYVPEKEGNVFLGWTTTKGSSTVEYGPGDKYEVNQELTLYPVWKEKYEIKYEVINGVLRIYGLGDMASYPTGKTPWVEDGINVSTITEIKIESGVTSIGSNAFANFTNLTKVTMPYGITKIGAKAFYGCKNLVSVNIPASASIGNRAFANCTKLQEVTMPGVATQALSTQSTTEVTIGAFAFENCASLASVDIPDTVTDIGVGAFTGCSAMETFEIPAGVEVINDSTFFGCSSLGEIDVPSGVTEIGDGAFSGCCAAETIVIPDTVDSIGDQAFSGCSVVTEVDIPESTDIIGAGAFTNCSALTTVDLPDDMEYIGEGMFSGCSALETVEIPDTVSYIGDGAFGYCSSLTGIEIPENVSEINNSTFYGCSSLQSFEVPATVVSIGDYAFGDCDNLKNVTISEGTASIGIGAFAFCDTLETVSVPASLTLIDDGAFMDCASLTNIELLESELVIGEDAFYGCSSLKDIKLPESIVSIGEGAFNNCSADFSLACFSTSSVYEQVVDTYDNVNVIYPVSGVTLDKSEVDLLVGQTLNLNATVAPANATCKDIIWSSNNPDYVSVDENGKVTALDGGRATITATTKDNAFVASCVINSIVPVKGISLGYNEVEAYVDEEFTMYYTFAPENPTDIEVKWSSSDENVATVSEDGTVKILSEGNATITVTTNDGGFKDSCLINATKYIEATGITIDESLELAVGESKQLQAQITPSNATSKDIFWLVEDMGIVEISDDGTVTAIKEGITEIYAYAGSEEGPEAICTVTVKPTSSTEPDVPQIKDDILIAIRKPSITTISYGDAIILHADVTGILPVGATIKWESSNGNFDMNVSTDGLTCTITPKKSGDTVFTVTVLDAEGNEVGKDEQIMTSKAGFFDKFVAFFKKLFGLTKVIVQSLYTF